MERNRSERIALAGIALGLFSMDEVADVLAARQRWDGDPGRAPPILSILRSRGLLDAEKERMLEGMVGAKAVVRLGGYEIHERIGRGGMGVVYRARHVELDREVAIKVLASKWKTQARFVEQFLQEARAVGRLRHPNIVSGFDAGTERGVHYVVMEYVDGDSLDRRLRARGVLPESEALEVARQVAAGLDHAYRHGFIHRDVKPQNVLFTSDGVAKLCDLGLVKGYDGASDLVGQGGGLGTLAYASPEQLQAGATCDIRTDVYSLGVTLYQMVTGMLPFPQESVPDTIRRRRETAPPDPGLPNPELSERTRKVVTTCLAPDREDRHPDPATLEKELARAIHELREGKVERSATPEKSTPKLRRRHTRLRRHTRRRRT